MATNTLPIYTQTPEDLNADLPRQTRFMLANYKYIIKFDTSPENIHKVRQRDRRVGKSMIRLLQRQDFMQYLQMTNYKLELNETRIPVRVFSHVNWAPSESPRIFIHFHGGGWVYGDLEFYSSSCFRWAHNFEGTVISIDYRKAPEFKYPTAFFDCLAATQWVLQNKCLLGREDAEVYLIGESAGGNLAAAVSLYFRNNGLSGLTGQILMYPAVDSRTFYKSIHKYAHGYLLTREAMNFFIDAYAKDVDDLKQQYFAPIRARSFENIIPTRIATGSHDILRDQAFEYYRQLENAKVDVDYRNYLIGLHGFLNAPELFYRGKEMFENFINWIREGLLNLPESFDVK